jgi:hypothetical protein
MRGKKYNLFFWMVLIGCAPLFGQQHKKSISLRDSLDGAFDMSDYIIEANGFVPVPYIITEPAFGGFGGALIPVFIKKRPPYVDSTKKGIIKTPVAPDITGGIIVYTVNDTWMLAGFRSGTFVKSRIKYVVGGGFANLNLSFYKTFTQVGEKELQFNIKNYPFVLQVSKRLRLSHWYAGLKYVFLHSETQYVGDKVLDSLTMSLDFTRTVSQLGAIVELDNRDNIFTPNKGVKLHVDGNRSDAFLGSDYDFWRVNYYMYSYLALSKRLTGGLRLDGQQTFGDIPFYLLPFVDMRGIPKFRYQGKANILSELELRWDVVRRWSIMLYGGTGKAFDAWSDFGSTGWVASYGTGFRYLLARKFKLRVGIDIAKGPEKWAYYIVFGSNWLK